MRDAIAFQKGDETNGQVVFSKPRKVDVAAVRAKTGLPQPRFAKKFMLPHADLQEERLRSLP
jgi:hypothetical protein